MILSGRREVAAFHGSYKESFGLFMEEVKFLNKHTAVHKDA